MKQKIDLFRLDYAEYNEGSIINLIKGLQEIVIANRHIDLLYIIDEDNITIRREETDKECEAREKEEENEERERELKQLKRLKDKYE